MDSFLGENNFDFNSKTAEHKPLTKSVKGLNYGSILRQLEAPGV